MNLPIFFRPATENDLNFVYDNWRKSFRDSDFAYTLTNDVYFHLQKAKMQAAVESQRITVACLAHDHDHLIGFMVHGKNDLGLTVVYYAYIKWHYRSKGMGRRMMSYIKPSVPVVCIDVTETFFDLRERHNLPYITARELEDFTLKRPADPMAEYTKWQHDQYYINQKRQADDQAYSLWKTQHQPKQQPKRDE